VAKVGPQISTMVAPPPASLRRMSFRPLHRRLP